MNRAPALCSATTTTPPHRAPAAQTVSPSYVCSVCGSPFQACSRTAGGLDAQGNVVLAGECCISRVAETFAMGLYSDRQYDFCPDAPGPRPTSNRGASRSATRSRSTKRSLPTTDRLLARIERRGGRFPRRPRALPVRPAVEERRSRLVRTAPATLTSRAHAVFRRSRRRSDSGPGRTGAGRAGAAHRARHLAKDGALPRHQIAPGG